MECHSIGGLNNRNVFSHSSGGWQSKTKVWPGLASPEVSLVCRWLSPAVSSHGLSTVCIQPWRRLCICMSSSYKDTSQIRSGFTLTMSF